MKNAIDTMRQSYDLARELEIEAESLQSRLSHYTPELNADSYEFVVLANGLGSGAATVKTLCAAMHKITRIIAFTVCSASARKLAGEQPDPNLRDVLNAASRAHSRLGAFAIFAFDGTEHPAYEFELRQYRRMLARACAIYL